MAMMEEAEIRRRAAVMRDVRAAQNVGGSVLSYEGAAPGVVERVPTLAAVPKALEFHAERAASVALRLERMLSRLSGDSRPVGAPAEARPAPAPSQWGGVLGEIDGGLSALGKAQDRISELLTALEAHV